MGKQLQCKFLYLDGWVANAVRSHPSGPGFTDLVPAPCNQQDWDIRPLPGNLGFRGPEAPHQFLRAQSLQGGVDQGEIKCAEAKEFERLQRAGNGRRPETGDRESILEKLAQVEVV
jgi:hypothetical protein